MFRYEIHLHSSACSKCSTSTAEELVDAAHAQGYAGLIFSNHFYHGNTAIDRNLPWKDFVAAYATDYENAKKYAAAYDMDILFGLEEVYAPGKECLIYGLNPEIIAAESNFLNFTLPQLSAFVRRHGGWTVCAHPFRHRDYIPNPEEMPDIACFDAIEVHNHFNSDADNEKALRFAQANGMPGTSGGDIHSAANIGPTGLAFFERILDNKALMEALKNHRYRLIVEGALKSPI